VTVEVASGSLGTDSTDTFVGTPEIPLPPPSPIALPRFPLAQRTRRIGTAKLSLLAYDTKSRLAVINTGYVLARSDHRSWNPPGVGGLNSGTVHTELAEHTGEPDSITSAPTVMMASRPGR